MKHRSVVSNFIFKWSNPEKTDQLVALFKRSDHPNIRSYQGKYAPISGSIEDHDSSSVVAAEREIKEETQLIPHRDLTLEFSGKTFSIVDEHAQRSWTIHPFGWILQADESKIQIDWEHSSWQWFDPQKVLEKSISDQCVPDLDKSLQRVYFGPNGMFRRGGWLIGRDNSTGTIFLQTVESLKTNTKDGARTLATEALRALLCVARRFRETPTAGSRFFEYWHALRVAAYHFIYSARPSMNAAIHANIIGALYTVSQHIDHNELDLSLACSVLESKLSSRDATSRQIGEALRKFVMKTAHQLNLDSQHCQSDQVQSQAPRRTVNIITISCSGGRFTLAERAQHKDALALTII